jgi:hypothetical protein
MSRGHEQAYYSQARKGRKGKKRQEAQRHIQKKTFSMTGRRESGDDREIYAS